MLLAKNSLFFISLFTTVSATWTSETTTYDPLKEITWTLIEDYGGVVDVGSPHYLDVIGHTNTSDPECPRANGMAFELASLQIHETEHVLHCQIRRLGENDNYGVEGLYYSEGRGIILTKPKTRVTDFAWKIPTELRAAPSPYQGYLVDQMQYEPLNNIGYLFNEWGSYCSNIILNLEFEKAGRPEPDWNGHAANYSPHFFGFLAYAMHHLRTAEPEALNDKQLKATFALYAEYTWKLMHDALSSPVFGSKNTMFGSRLEEIMKFYRTSPNFAEVRESLMAIYGEDWVIKLMK